MLLEPALGKRGQLPSMEEAELVRDLFVKRQDLSYRLLSIENTFGFTPHDVPPLGTPPSGIL